MIAGAEIMLAGERLVATRAGALYWRDQETLVVSDLHFEKGSHFAARGVMLPPYDTRATLARLAALVEALGPKRVISLGDAFHDGDAEARMGREDAETLERIVAATDWIWVLGNHDPAPPARFAGTAERALEIGKLRFRHEPEERAPPGEIAGHFHPVARVKADSRIVRRRCFATDGARLVMPAFGAFAGGLNILDKAIAGLFGRPLTAWMIGESGVYFFPEAALVPDANALLQRTS